MADRLLRHIPTGQLFVYQEAFAARDDFEEIIDVESRIIDEPTVKKPRAKRPEVEKVDDETLGVEAARGLP